MKRCGDLLSGEPLANKGNTVFDPALDQFVTDGNAQNVVLAVKNNYATLQTTP